MTGRYPQATASGVCFSALTVSCVAESLHVSLHGVSIHVLFVAAHFVGISLLSLFCPETIPAAFPNSTTRNAGPHEDAPPLAVILMIWRCLGDFLHLEVSMSFTWRR